jgi:hypothetical protein
MVWRHLHLVTSAIGQGSLKLLDVFTMVLVPMCVCIELLLWFLLPVYASVCCTRGALILAYWPGSSAVCEFACLCSASAGMLRHSSIICVHYLCSLVVLCHGQGSGGAGEFVATPSSIPDRCCSWYAVLSL